MAQTSRLKPDVILFFDACMEKMQACNAKCGDDQSVLCKHRFNFDAQALYTNGYIGFLRFSDFQVILHCFYLIKKRKMFQQAAKNGKFFIITKDKKFLYDAEKVWQEKKKANTNPNLGFNTDEVFWGSFKIRVHTISCKNYGVDGHDDLICTIKDLNKIFPNA